MLDHRLIQWAVACSLLPYPVPNELLSTEATGFRKGTVPLVAWLDTLEPAALILSGGSDLGSFPNRDNTEMLMLDWAANRRIPVLGICRGMQMLAHHAGVKLSPVKNHVGHRHYLNGDKEGWPGSVNSYHNMAIADCPKDYKRTAIADDGTIEAIKSTSLPWEGWMWHPERENPFSLRDIQRFKSLVENGQIS